MTLTQLKEKLGLSTVSDAGGLIEKGCELLFCPARDQAGHSCKPRLVDTYVGEYCLYKDTILYQLACPPSMRNHFVQVPVEEPTKILAVSLILSDGKAIHYDSEAAQIIKRDLENGTHDVILSFASGQACNIDSTGIHQHMYDRATGLPYDRVYSFDGNPREKDTKRSLQRSVVESLTLMVRNDQYDRTVIKNIIERYVDTWPLNFKMVDRLVEELQLHGLTDQKRVQRFHRLKSILLNGGAQSEADAATILGICIGAYNHRKSEIRKSSCPSDHFLNLLENYQQQNREAFCDHLKSASVLYKAIHSNSTRR